MHKSDLGHKAWRVPKDRGRQEKAGKQSLCSTTRCTRMHLQRFYNIQRRRSTVQLKDPAASSLIKSVSFRQRTRRLVSFPLLYFPTGIKSNEQVDICLRRLDHVPERRTTTNSMMPPPQASSQSSDGPPSLLEGRHPTPAEVAAKNDPVVRLVCFFRVRLSPASWQLR